eukprot:COSAG01_NODE_54777_length_329_cov_12.339130_1_plen_70_part_01
MPHAHPGPIMVELGEAVDRLIYTPLVTSASPLPHPPHELPLCSCGKPPPKSVMSSGRPLGEEAKNGAGTL